MDPINPSQFSISSKTIRTHAGLITGTPAAIVIRNNLSTKKLDVNRRRNTHIRQDAHSPLKNGGERAKERIKKYAF